MYSQQINNILTATLGDKYAGCYAADTLPEQLNDTAVVVNFDKNNFPGSHWICCFKTSLESEKLYYFDSYGVNPLIGYKLNVIPKDIMQFLRKNAKQIQYNKRRVQDFGKNTCGDHSIYLLIQCIGNNHSFDKVVNFLYNINGADEFVRKFRFRLEEFINPSNTPCNNNNSQNQTCYCLKKWS
jgi:hypothetical protein